MANFNEFTTPERKLSDVVTPQQGVEDRSAATKAAGQVQMLDASGKLATTAFAQVQESNQKQGFAQYEALLQEEADMRSQGVPDSKIDVWRKKEERKLATVIGLEDRLTIRSKYDKAFGGVLTQKSFEDLQREADNKLAIEIGVDPSTEAGQTALTQHRKVANMTGADAAQIGSSMQPVLIGQLENIVNSGLPPEQVALELEKMKFQTRSDIFRLVPNKELRDTLVSQYDGMIDAYAEAADPATLASNAEAQNKVELQSVIANFWANASPTEEAMIGYSNLAGRGGDLVSKQLMTKLGPGMMDAFFPAAANLENGMYAPASDGGKAVTLAAATSGQNLVELGETSEGYEKSTTTMFNEASLRLPSSSPDDVKSFVEGLAGGMGEYYRANEGRYDSETKEKLGESLRAHFVDVVHPIVSEALNEKFGSKVGRVGARDMESGAERIDSIDLVTDGDRILFTAKTSDAQLNVQSLNKDISKDLTTYAKALANVSGGTLEDQVALLKTSLFPEAPEKLVPETTGETEAVAPVSQEGVSQGSPVAPEEAVVLERELGERTLAEVQGTPYEEEYKRLNSLLDTVEDPSTRYVLKKNYKDLLGDIGAGTSTGGRSGKVRKQEEVPVGDMPPAEKAVSGESFETRAKLRAVDGVEQVEARASDYLVEDEGYSESSGIFVNVPTSKSGLTVAGIDLGSNGKYKLDLLTKYAPEASKYQDAIGKKGKSAQAVLDSEGELVLTDDQIAQIQDEYISEKVRPWYEKKIGERLYSTIDPRVRAAYEALGFLNLGSNTAAAMKKGAETGNWKDAIRELENYWADKSNKHNNERAKRVADLIRSYENG